MIPIIGVFDVDLSPAKAVHRRQGASYTVGNFVDFTLLPSYGRLIWGFYLIRKKTSTSVQDWTWSHLVYMQLCYVLSHRISVLDGKQGKAFRVCYSKEGIHCLWKWLGWTIENGLVNVNKFHNSPLFYSTLMIIYINIINILYCKCHSWSCEGCDHHSW